MTRIIKTIFVAISLFLLSSVSAQAQIFEGLEGEGGETLGICLENPEADECDGVDCDDPEFETDPRCISQAEAGTGLAKTSLDPTGITHTDSLAALIIKYVNFVLPYLTLAAFVGFVVAGFFYVTAYGNEEQLAKSKKILIWSAVGLILVIASYSIVQLLTQGLVEAL